MIIYFGTNLTEHGHYMWEIDNNGFHNKSLYTTQLGFDVEQIGKPEPGEYVIKGQVRMFSMKGYTVLKIEGSSVDDRGGTRSVFIIKGSHYLSQMKNMILENETGYKIIDEIGKKFPVLW